MNIIVLEKDLLIPAGTIFNNCDGRTSSFNSGNYNQIIGTGKDGTIDIYINEDVVSDRSDLFRLIELSPKPIERALQCPSKHSLIECLRDLKYGRRALDQKIIDKIILALEYSELGNE